jgi:hypothetical protein
MKSLTVSERLELSKLIDEIAHNLSQMRDEKLIVSEQQNGNYYTVFLSSYDFWTEHYDELCEWSQQYSGIKVLGMTVQIDSEELLTVFLLKWN